MGKFGTGLNMQHIAIMKPAWKLLPKILSGEKTVESRWYKTRRTPWGKIKKGDTLFFKDSGKPVSVKSTVTKVEQFEINSNRQALEIMQKYALSDLGTDKLSPEIKDYIKNKNYAIFIHFNRTKRVKAFEIDKNGFGMQSAWICVENINSIKVN